MPEQLTIHVMQDFRDEVTSIHNLHPNVKISEVKQELEEKLQGLRESSYHLKHKNVHLCDNHTLKHYGIKKNPSIIDLQILRKRKHFRVWKGKRFEVTFTRQFKFGRHVEGPHMQSPRYHLGPFSISLCTKSNILQEDDVAGPLSGMITPTTKSTPEVQDEPLGDPALHVVDGSTNQKHPSVECRRHLDSDGVQMSQVGRQGGLSGSISEMPASEVSEQKAVIPDIDPHLVDTTMTVKEFELPAEPERVLPTSCHDTTGRTVINAEGVVKVCFNFQPYTFKVNFNATVRDLKDDLYNQELVSLSPNEQCVHFQKDMLSDEQQLHECGIQHGSKVYIHFKRDDSQDHSMSDGGIPPAAMQPSSTQERRWVLEPNFDKFNDTRKIEKKSTEEGINDYQTHIFPGICGHWTQEVISNSITQEDFSPCGLLFELLTTLVDNEREQRCSAYDTEITYYRASKRIIDEMENQISSENSQHPKQPHSECDKLSITRRLCNTLEESLDYIHGLWNKISEQFHLPQRHVVLHDIECIWVTWHIPAKEGIRELIANYIPSSELFLKENNITSITFNDECLFCQVSVSDTFSLYAMTP